MTVIRHRRFILAKVLIPADFALIAVQLIAECTSREFLLCKGRALSRSNSIQIEATVQRTLTSAECVTVIKSRSFCKTTCCITIVQNRKSTACRISHKSAIHRTPDVSHFTQRSAVVESYVTIQGTSHTAITCNTTTFTCNIYICNHVLYEHITLHPAIEGTKVNGCYNGFTFNTQVTDGSAVHVCEETTVVFCHHVAIGNGVTATIKDTFELSVCRTYHQVRIVEFGQIDVVCQERLDIVITLQNLLVQPVQLLGIANKIITLCVLLYSVGICLTANNTDSVSIKLMVRFIRITFCITESKRVVFKFCTITTDSA